MLHELPELGDLPTLEPGPQPAPDPRDVHLWHHKHVARLGPARLSSLLALLSPDDRARFARLRDESRQRQFLVGRALCRQALSRYAPIPPDAWQFTLGSRGKPTLAAPALATPLWFNLSHADTISICAITGAGPGIGIDIEPLATGRSSLGIAEQFFPLTEANALRQLPIAQRGEAFVRLWALKESFVKASEASLADGISSVAFDLARPGDIRVTFGEPLHERGQGWQFRLLRLDPEHVVALAARTNRRRALRLRAGTGL